GPLFRLSFLMLSAAEHLLLLALPALCADRTTLQNLVRDLSRAYAAGVAGEELLDTPSQFADLAEWQTTLLEATDTQRGREYWRKQDLSALFTTKLPFEQQSPAASFTPRLLARTLPAEVGTRIAALVQSEGIEVATFMLACWQVVVWHLTGQSDLTLGLVCDGRRYGEVQEGLGALGRDVPLRMRMQDGLAFRALLGQGQTAVDEVRKRQEYFSWEHAEGLAGEVSRPPFFPWGFEAVEQEVKETVGEVTFALDQQYTCIDRVKVQLGCTRREDALPSHLLYPA